MTQEEKQLLLTDLCSRIPYNVNIKYNGEVYNVLGYTNKKLIIMKPFMSNAIGVNVEECKPCLCQMLSMTEEEKEIKINIPEGYEIDKEKSTFEHIVFKKKENKLPKTWKEFCLNYSVKEGEYYIGYNSEIFEKTTGVRLDDYDKNILPSKELVEAVIALCQLIQLRDCYNQGWKPDWTTDDFKYCIAICSDKVYKNEFWKSNKILTFKTKELRDEFYNNFKYLIEIAKPLL